MTPPMTPREKVELTLKSWCEGGLLQDYASVTDAILTALASGSGDQLSGNPGILKSGDHAELVEEGGDCDTCDGAGEVEARIGFGTDYVPCPECVSRENRAEKEALLAENAALRETNTEAERKLAEAEDENARWAFRFAEVREAAGIGVKPMLSEVPGELLKMRSLINRAADLMRQCTDPERFEGASTLNVYANMRAWLSDLSKEAERG